jgi:hypothetical protein
VNRSTQGAERRRRNLLALRVAAFIAAIALGVIGIWMIVTGNSTKSIRIGAIASFWALLLGAFAVLGSRVPGRDPERAADPVEPAPERLAPPPPRRGELDIRHIGDIERATVAATRREFQAELQEMLRREVAAAVSREMAGLRSEVTALRNELVEQVGGQLRLERIETTRLIGSDLEALQHEVRQLRRTAGLEADPTRAMRITHTLVAPRTSPDADVHDAEIVVERVHPPAEPEQPTPIEQPVEPVAESETERLPDTLGAAGPPPPPEAPPEPPATTSAEAAETPAESEPGPQPAPWPDLAPTPTDAPPEAPAERPPEAAAESVAAAAPAGADPFAGLPRITPFTEFPLDPISGAPDPDEPDEDADYDDSEHRHRADDGGHDVLARILARERGD